MDGDVVGLTETQVGVTETAIKAKGGRPKKARGASNSSDGADARWTVRGVPENVRAMANKAAKNRGMTVGDWLAEAIVSSARDTLSADGKNKLPALPMPELVDLVKTMNDRLTAMERKQGQGLFGRLFGRPNVGQVDGKTAG